MTDIAKNLTALQRFQQMPPMLESSEMLFHYHHPADVKLDCVIAGDDEDGFEVREIYHHGADVAGLFDGSLDDQIIDAWIEHCEESNTDIQIERACHDSSSCY